MRNILVTLEAVLKAKEGGAYHIERIEPVVFTDVLPSPGDTIDIDTVFLKVRERTFAPHPDKPTDIRIYVDIDESDVKEIEHVGGWKYI